MKQLNKNLSVSKIEIYDTDRDRNLETIPSTYMVYFDFLGFKYEMELTVEAIKDYMTGCCGLSCYGLDGSAELFDSMDTYFEDDCHKKEADTLIKMIEETWESAFYYSKYDFIGNKREK